jgi:mxaA protein
MPSFWRLRLLAASAALALTCCGAAQAQDAGSAPTAGADAADAPSTPPKPTGYVIPPPPDPAAAAAEPAAAPAEPAIDVATPPAPAISAINPEVDPLRPFGYVIGDLVTQRVALEYDGKPLDLGKLPPLERAGNWFERRDARIERDAAGHRWLVMDYQIINVPEELRAIELPALDIETAVAGRRLQTSPIPLTVAPITPNVVLARAGLDEMRPDAPAPHVDTAPYERGLHAALYAGALLVALWAALALLRQFNARRRLPFSRAQRDIARLDAGSIEAWRRLHRALDDTAGQVVRDQDLPLLLARAPWLASMEADLRRFFEASQTRFFADRAVEGVEPRTLCAQAAKLERRALA